jgi:hypothetical protein
LLSLNSICYLFVTKLNMNGCYEIAFLVKLKSYWSSIMVQ